MYPATAGFDPEPLQDRSFDGTLHSEETYRVDATVLDHGVPVLGVALREAERLAVDKDRLQKIGLEPGPWLNDLKSAVRRGCSGHEEVEASASDGSLRRIRTDELAADVLSRAPGQEIAYLTDFGFSTTNVEKAVALARGVQLLVCEAAFLHRDEALARERRHLTARQAGELAREARAKTLALFHVSPRYDGKQEELLEEAAAAFEGPVVRLPQVV